MAWLDACDAPTADMEPDDDGEGEPDEASWQPVERRFTAANVIGFPKARHVQITWRQPPLPEGAE